MLNIKIFSDFACPFCYLATGFFDKLKKDGVNFSLEWIPYEMYPHIPLEGKSIESKHPQGYHEKMLEFQNNLGKEYGIKFENQTMDYNTHRALLAGEYAKSVEKYDEFSKNAFKAYFHDLKNLGDLIILNHIAIKSGINVEEMNNLIDSGKFDSNIEEAKKLIKKLQVKGTPTFIINNKHKMVGMRPYEQMKDSFLSFK